jgi:hypothetical protein
MACGSCHGAPPAGHYLGTCSTCHAEANATGTALSGHELHLNGRVDLGDGSGKCGACHGQGDDAWPSTAAHRQHQKPSVTAPISCASCHIVPGSVLEPQHLDGRATVTFAGHALDRGADATWNGNTCTSVACHGAELVDAPSVVPVWTDTSARRTPATRAMASRRHNTPRRRRASAPSATAAKWFARDRVFPFRRAVSSSTSTVSSMCARPDGAPIALTFRKRDTPYKPGPPAGDLCDSRDTPWCTSRGLNAAECAWSGTSRTPRATKRHARRARSSADDKSRTPAATVCRSVRAGGDNSRTRPGSTRATRSVCSRGTSYRCGAGVSLTGMGLVKRLARAMTDRRRARLFRVASPQDGATCGRWADAP